MDKWAWISNIRLFRTMVLLSLLCLSISCGDSKRTSLSSSGVEAPGTLTGQPGDRQITLSWESSSDGGQTLTPTAHKYRKKVETGEYGDWINISDSGYGESSGTSFVVTELTNGTGYAFEVRALNGDIESPSSNEATATPATVPDAPSDLAATPRNGEIVLSWTVSSSDGGNAIIRHQYQQNTGGGSQGWLDIPNSEAGGENVASYTVPNLTNGTNYIFQIRAVNGIGNSSGSSSISGTPAEVPDAPTGLGATPRDREVGLFWTASSSSGGSAIMRHEYQQDGGEWQSIPDSGPSGANATSHTVSSLTNGTSYDFQVRAVNVMGESPASNTISGIPSTVPDAPSGLAATPRNGEVDLSWIVSSSSGGSAIMRHEYQQNGGGWESIPDSGPSGANATSHTVSNLTNGTSYDFQVRAVNGMGESLASSLVTTTPATVPDAPSGLAATPRNGEVDLSWIASSSNGGSAIIRHQYQQNAGAGFQDWVDIPNSEAGGANATSYTVSSLTNGTSYDFQVRAVNGMGESLASSPVTTTPATVPDAPTGLGATPRNGEVDLFWTASSSNGESVIMRHEYQQDGGVWESILDSGPSGANATSHTVSNLTNGTSYDFQVRAVNGMGESLASNTISATPATVPDAPSGLAATPRNGEVDLSWIASSSNGGSAIIRHQYQQDDGGGFQGWVNIPDSEPSGANATSHTVSSLTNGTSYDFQVRAVNGMGDSLASSPVTTTPATVPDAPSILIATLGNEEVELSWIASSSDGGNAITEHQYRQDDGGGFQDWVDIPSSDANGVNATSYTVSSLTNGTSYDFQVRAVNGIGDSPASNTISATPNPNLLAPTKLTAHPRNEAAYLIWSPLRRPSDNEIEARIVQGIHSDVYSSAPHSGLSGGDVCNVGQSIITHYQYRHRHRQKEKVGEKSYEEWVDIPNSALGEINEASYMVKFLSNDTPYAFEVRAVCHLGHSSPSNLGFVEPSEEEEAPWRPTNLMAHSWGETTYLTWKTSRSDGGSVITKYQYRQKFGKVEETGKGDHEEEAYNEWVDIPQSAPGEVHETSYIVPPSLTSNAYNNGSNNDSNDNDDNNSDSFFIDDFVINEVVRTFEVRAVNKIFSSPSSNPKSVESISRSSSSSY